MATVEYEGSACVDCVMILANDDDSGIESPELHRVAMALHSEGIAWFVSCDGEDNHEHFSTAPCSVCGTYLAGDRCPVFAFGN